MRVMNENKLHSLLGLSRKAGKLSLGHDASLYALLRGNAALCLLSQDASERLEAEFRRVAQQNEKQPGQEVPVMRIPFTMDEIGQAVSLRSAVLTVNDAGFSRTIQQAFYTPESNNNREDTPYD